MRQGKITNLHKVLAIMMIMGLAAAFTGCSDDESPVVVPTTGSVAVDVSPDEIGASWILASQDKLLAVVQGDSTLAALAPGSYTLTWGEATGWNSPTPGQIDFTLEAGQALQFTGAYSQTPGTIIVDVNKDALNASWTLTGPGGAETTGAGDATLTDMPVGIYSMAWGAVTDYITPANEQKVVGNGATVTFAGVYNVDVPAGFSFVPGGTFAMGAPESELGREADEVQHTVTVSNGYLMSASEVTEQMWDAVMGGGSTSQMPHTSVSWDDAVAFCNAMSEAEGYTPAYTINGPGDVTWNRDADGYRLPTEAEWELACRAGSTTAYPDGDITVLFCDYDADLDAVAWYCQNSGSSMHEAGLKAGNAYGLHDMLGNAWEWCWDAYVDAYENLGATDPVNDGGATDKRIVRGGGYTSYTHYCRAAARSSASSYLTHALYGFRVVRTIH